MRGLLPALWAVLATICLVTAVYFGMSSTDAVTPSLSTDTGFVTTKAAILTDKKPPKPYEPSADKVGTYAASVSLWKQRVDGRCYIFVEVPGWEAIYLDASGDICDRIGVVK